MFSKTPARRRPLAAFALLALALVACLLALPSTARAATDTAGNELETDATPSNGIEGDLYWAGETLNFEDASVDRDVIAAGASLTLDSVNAGGAVRMAGQTINIARTTASGSITVAGQHISINEGTSAPAVYAAGQTINFLGSAKAASLAGETVTLDGKIDGDVHVYAKRLVIGSNARISGTVYAQVSEKPERSDDAKVGALKIDMTQSEDSTTGGVAGIIFDIVFSMVSGAFIALVIAFVLPRAVGGAADMTKSHPVAVWLTGFIGILGILPITLLVMLTVAGLPIAGALIALLIAIGLIATPFAAAVVGQALLPKWNRFASAAAAGAGAGLITCAPILGSGIKALAFMLIFGYVIQTVIGNARKPQAGAPTAPQSPQLPQA